MENNKVTIRYVKSFTTSSGFSRIADTDYYTVGYMVNEATAIWSVKMIKDLISSD